MESIFKNRFIEILYNKQQNMLIQNWSETYSRFEEFKESIDKTLQFFSKYNITRLLSDTTRQAAIHNESLDYAASVIPEMKKLGLKKMAFLSSHNVFFISSINKFILKTSMIKVSVFDSKNEAVEWLLDQDA